MASRTTTDPIEILLEMGVDLDNLSNEEDYLSALMEAAATIEFQTKGSGDERSAALRKEIIKVRKKRKAADPKFKVKKTQISAGAFKKQSSVAKVSRSQKALPGSAGGAVARSKPSKGGALVTQGGEDGRGSSILEKILAGVNSILKTLKEDREFKKKLANQERKSAERKKRGAKEDKLESGIFKNILKGAKKILKPVEGILSRILKFIGTILIGKVLKKIVAWMSDPKNEGKLEAIGNFLEVTWPAILGAFLVFSTGFGGIITGLIALVARFIPRIAATIVKLAASNPLAAAAIAGAGLFVAGAVIPKLMPGTVDEQERKTAAEPGTAEEKIKKLEEQKSKLNFLERMQGVGAEIDEQIKFLETGKTAAYSGGGLVQGFSGGGHAHGRPRSSGTDTIPAMLTPGEFVMSRGAVQKYGSGTLASMNAAGGGTNRPTMLDGTLYAKTGGHVHAGPDVEPAEENRQSAEKQPKVPAGDSYKPTKGGPDRSRTASVQPMEPLIPGTDKDKSKAQLSAEKANAELLSFISKGEGGYNSMNQGTSGGGIIGSTHNASSILGKNLPDMTVSEVMSHQASGKLFAAGRYQIIPSTMKLAVARAGVSPDDMFDQKTQDKLGLALIYNGQRPTLSGYLQGKNDNLHGAMLDLALEWASAPHPDTGRSAYPPANKSSHTVGEVEAALTKAKEMGAGKFMSASPSSSIAKSGSTSSSISSTNGGGATEKPKMSDADQLAFATGRKGAFDYNKIREQIGTKTSSVSRSSRPSSTAAYQEQLQSQQGQQGQPSYSDEKTGKDVPQINADAMISQQKIQVLGIAV